jgi:hypothetical protein
VQNQRQLSLHGTNITPIQNSKMQPASSFIQPCSIMIHL